MSQSPTFVGYELLDRAGMIDSNDDRLISNIANFGDGGLTSPA